MKVKLLSNSCCYVESFLPVSHLNKHRCVHLLFWKALVSLSVGSLPEHSLPVSHLANKRITQPHTWARFQVFCGYADKIIGSLFSELICSANHLPDLNTLAATPRDSAQDPSAHKGSDPSFFSSILFPIRERRSRKGLASQQVAAVGSISWKKQVTERQGLFSK